MFARTVRMQLKPNSVAEFAQTIEKDIIPLLRSGPMGLLRVYRGVLWPPTPAHAEGSPPGGRA